MDEKVEATWAEEDGAVIGYMCGTDWQYEIGGAEDGNHVYPSIDAAKKYSGCWRECGIVEVRVLFSRVIEPCHFGEEPTASPSLPSGQEGR